jgi:hypothetical protein
MALRNHREILSHRGLDVVPFFRQLPATTGSVSIPNNRAACSSLRAAGLDGAVAAFVPSSMNETASNSLAAKVTGEAESVGSLGGSEV